MSKQRGMSDEAVKKQLGAIQKRVLRDAGLKLRKGQLSAESLELFLPTVSEHYEHLRAVVGTAQSGALAEFQHANSALLGEIGKLISTLDVLQQRRRQAYEAVRTLAVEAGVAESEVPEEDTATIEPLRARFARFQVTGEGAL